MTILTMSLKLSNRKRILKIIFLVLVASVFVFFFAKIIIFENRYYEEKDGSEREEPVVLED